jgi:hypothetical protein
LVKTKMRTYPAVIVLVEHANELTSVEIKFILHGRLEVKLNTMYIVRTRTGSRALGTSAGHCASDRRGTGRSWARRSRNVLGPCWACRNTDIVGGDWWWRGKFRLRRRA